MAGSTSVTLRGRRSRRRRTRRPNLTATAASASQINLAWADNSSNETGFDILRCQGAACAGDGDRRPSAPASQLQQHRPVGQHALSLSGARLQCRRRSAPSNVAQATTTRRRRRPPPTNLTAAACRRARSLWRGPITRPMKPASTSCAVKARPACRQRSSPPSAPASSASATPAWRPARSIATRCAPSMPAAHPHRPNVAEATTHAPPPPAAADQSHGDRGVGEPGQSGVGR